RPGRVSVGAFLFQHGAPLPGCALFPGTALFRSFVLVNSSNAAISGTFFSTAVTANGDYDTPPVTVNLGAGTYHWVVSFTGDANNAAPPAVTDQAFTVTPASPTLTTTILHPTAPA